LTVVAVFSNNPGSPARDVSWSATFDPSTTACTFTGTKKGSIHLEPRARVAVPIGVQIPTSLPTYFECCMLHITATESGGEVILGTANVDLCPAAITPQEIDPADRIPLLSWLPTWRAVPADDSRRFDAVISNQTNNTRTYYYTIEALPLDGAPPFTLNGTADAVVDSARLDAGMNETITLLVGAPHGAPDGARNELRFTTVVETVSLHASAIALAGDFTSPVVPATWGRLKALYSR
jgi:hypothetical protein